MSLIQPRAHAGFMLPRPYTPDWWLWFTYLTPPGWSMLAITVDQAGDKVHFYHLLLDKPSQNSGFLLYVATGIECCRVQLGWNSVPSLETPIMLSCFSSLSCTMQLRHAVSLSLSERFLREM